MIWRVYILECGNGNLYTGATNNLERRLKEHQNGKGGKFTRAFKAGRSLYCESCAGRSQALKREAQIKGWTRESKLALIRGKIKVIILLFCALALFQATADCRQPQQHCLLVAQLQEPSILSSRVKIAKLISTAKESGSGIIFLQVYRANRAWFLSKMTDASAYNSCFKSLAEDPINLFIKQSHAEGIKVYAWFNLLSLNENSQASTLKKYGTDILARNRDGKKSLEDYKIDRQYFLEPGDSRVRQELVSLVEEALLAYPGLDGILFDYLRYPDVKPDYGYSKMNIERFKKATGCEKIEKDSLLWQNWKREQVSGLLALLVKKTRALRPELQIGATGCVPYIRAYAEAFQDWPSWVNRGLVDFIFLMSYSADSEEFNKNVQEAKEKVRDIKKLYIGLPAYKLTRSPGVFKRELRIAELSQAGGYGIFHYDSLLENPDLINILKGIDKAE